MYRFDLDLEDPALTPELAVAQVVDYMDNFYNPERRHSTLDYLSSIEYELIEISETSVGDITHVSTKPGQAQWAEVFRSVGGAAIRDLWCGPCFGQGSGALQRGERAITSFNRNWQNRMGVGGEGYLAGPMVVAASTLAGY